MADVEGASDHHTKGVNVVQLVKFLRDADKKGALPELSERERGLIDQRILVSSWYPFDDFVVLLNRVHQLLGGTPEAAEQMGEIAARTSLEGVHNAFIRKGEPGYAVRAIEKVWPSYFDFGRAEVQSDDEGLSIVIDGYPYREAVHGHLLVGWIRGAATLAGASPTEVSLRSSPPPGGARYVVSVRLD